jgi:hypothetical protein
MARLLTAQDTEDVVEVTEQDLRVDDPDPDTRYTIRLLSEKAMREIRRKHTSKRPNRTGQMVETSDEEAIGFDIVDVVIKDWAGIVARQADGSLVPVPCTRDAKRGLDPYVRSALVEYASHNQRVEAEAQAASFRRAP